MRSFVLLILVALALVSPSHAGACPINELVVRGAPPFYTDAAQYDSALTSGDAVFARAAYDLAEAWLAVLNPGSLGGTSAKVRDAYDVTGVPPGTIVPVRVEMAVEGVISTDGCGGSGCWGNVTARVRSGEGLVEESASFQMYAPEQRPFQFTIELPLSLVAGQPTEIEFELVGWRPPGASHTSLGTAAFRFLDLPAGAGITSCNGFVGWPTPAHRASWGRVKAVYR